MLPASLAICRLSTWVYAGSLVVAGGAALVGLFFSLLDLAIQLSRTALALLAF